MTGHHPDPTSPAQGAADELDAIVFDMDDTLIDWHGAEAAAIRALATRVDGHEPHTVVSMYDRVKQENFEAFARDGKWWFLRDRLVRLEHHLEMQAPLDDWEATFIDAARGNLDYYAGAKELLASARKHHAVGILTNGPAHVQRPKVERLGIEATVDALRIAGEMNKWKPDAAAFHQILEDLGATRQRSMMVGDSLQFDIQPAKRLGMRTAWVCPPPSTATMDAVVAPRRDAAALTPPSAHPDADHIIEHITHLARHVRALRS